MTEPAASTAADVPIGERIRSLREARGYSLRAIERRTEGRLRSSHLSQVENGKVKEPSLAVLRELAGAFDLHLGSLMALLQIVEPDGSAQTENESLVLSFVRNLDDEARAEAIQFLRFISQRSAHGKTSVT